MPSLFAIKVFDGHFLFDVKSYRDEHDELKFSAIVTPDISNARKFNLVPDAINFAISHGIGNVIDDGLPPNSYESMPTNGFEIVKISAEYFETLERAAQDSWGSPRCPNPSQNGIPTNVRCPGAL